MYSLLQAWALPAALLAIVNLTATWYNVVSNKVPEPYLDEFFHVPQAQKYCIRDYSWDPKITTPPGLYLVSKFLEPLLGCDTSSLRALNAGALCLICPLSYGILRILRGRINPGQQEPIDEKTIEEKSVVIDPTIVLDAHSALNIALFPPLFFFSALYYTDVMSTLVVLLSYSAFLKKSSASGSILENINAVCIGIMALFFRQTNIFWVAVFPAGLAVVNALKGDNFSAVGTTRGDTSAVIRRSWDKGVIHDCSIQDARPQDIALFLVSLPIAALKNIFLIMRVAVPYITLLALFVTFVVWNGSVVLGDKSAHTATIHIPQMLYFWPYIAFFSAPLIVGLLLQPLLPLLPKPLRTLCNDNFNISSNMAMPTVLISTLIIVGGLAAVHFNTIIHPYTLADNRHYVFYVFRILRQHPAIKYLAVPVYFACAWLTIQSLASSRDGEETTRSRRIARPTSDKADRPPCQVSFITIWLVTTALSVITAPLVEPRYFIVPWIIWRLHLPYTPASLSKDKTAGKVSYDMRLGLETVWLLAINVVVMYIFLYRGFAWPSEPGMVQRFIW
ncbi:glycosyltransferase family 59 protein [Cucurbitaria berberidis CBS 394.84]|uniref:Dol-P-Glc:Glc(2)Man(9)GlcNAc(2)-PP-Dol alpha-1,2-glucosyltransferase n=1 Tax=Cucurbitaria berberidis CBS 394.84 TaxID=1168544 RepID=A0A9P4GNP8_9PLEO|nr:glycosyltransferase family 59 protein [Cucurbitaria berberidis CBS 394.84]KAF1849843.1 glycosyltransferase family 59 protein [Cucurbitaria berberidis CBS 394.84]